MGRRLKGHIRKHGAGYQVIVCAGTDPVTKRKHYLRETARDSEEAERIRDRLVRQVEDGRAPEGRATVGTLLDRWLAIADLEASTRHGYEGYIGRTIKPVLGDIPVRKLQGRLIDELYAHLRRCRKLCDGRPFIERHRRHLRAGRHDCVKARCQPHDCAKAACKPHRCQPMAPATIRQIHAILSTALKYAVKWGWIETNPASNATRPKLRARNVNPPSPETVGKLLNAAWKYDPALGVFLWLKMCTGARRGEMCALRWGDVLWDEEDIVIRRNYVTRPGQRVIKDTKSHQQRPLALDEETLAVLRQHLDESRKVAAELGGQLDERDGYIFSRDGLGNEPWLPDTVSHQVKRLVGQVGLDHRLHDLRHYNATQLLTAAGTDLRTVAGRLGHSGGGATTLRVYTHRTRAADQRAATFLGQQLRSARESDTARNP